MKQILTIIILTAINLASCTNSNKTDELQKSRPTIGSVEILDPMGNTLIDSNAVVEILGEGYTWSEGPLWFEKQQMLLFSDVPHNIVYQWTEKEGVTPYLEPSGYTKAEERGGEMGSNGLLLNKDGKLILCQHGDHAIATMNADITQPQPDYITLTNSYNNKRLNSPNDITQDQMGNYYFTDPGYGLAKKEDQELPFSGVYKIDNAQKTSLLIDSISHPNGIALSPDGKTLYISNSGTSTLYAYNLDEEKNIQSGGVFFDFRNLKDQGSGGTDGLKVDSEGYIFTTGPGGVWILSKEGKPLAKINTEITTSNCSLSKDGKTLYMTSTDKVLRINMRK